MVLPLQKEPEKFLENMLVKTKNYNVDSFIKSADVCVDVGANVGAFTINYHHLFNKIYAIEASKNNAKLCRRNCKKHNVKNAEIINKAVGKNDDETVELKMYCTEDENEICNSGSYGVINFQWGKDGHGWRDTKYNEKVKTISLEKILKKTGPIDCLKVDIEGSEYEFLYEKDLSQIDFIFMEFHNFLVEQEKDLEFLKWISKSHFLLSRWERRADIHQDLVFKRKEDEYKISEVFTL
jgi:FkbM family methyltransferase